MALAKSKKPDKQRPRLTLAGKPSATIEHSEPLPSLQELISEVSASGSPKPSALQEIPIEQLNRNPKQPRTKFDNASLSELASTIEKVGVIEPIIVRPTAVGQYEILAGERRWRAAQKAGLVKVPAIVREVDDRTAQIITLIENLQREDLNPIEEATALQSLMNNYGLSQVRLGQLIGKAKSTISQSLGLLKLHTSIQNNIVAGQLSAGVAKALIGLPAKDQIQLATAAIKEGWSARDLERRRSLINTKQNPTKARQNRLDPNISYLQERLSSWLASPVTCKVNKRGEGQIVIRFHSLEECDGILDRIGYKRDDL